MIVVVEGPSAAGKSTWITRHCNSAIVVEETTTATATPDADTEPLAVSEFWNDQNSLRWRAALRIEDTHGVAICDSDPFKLHYA